MLNISTPASSSHARVVDRTSHGNLPHARFRDITDPAVRGLGGRVEIWNEALGATAKVRTKDCGKCSENRSGITQDLKDRIEDVVERAREYLQNFTHDPNVKVVVNFSSLKIEYRVTGGDRWDNLSRKQIHDPELLALMEEIQSIAKDAMSFSITTVPGSESNRPMGAPAPLEKTTKAWRKLFAQHAPEFSRKQHKSLDKALKRHPSTAALATTAVPKIRAANLFIDRFKADLEDKRRRAQAALDAIPLAMSELRKAKKSQIAYLDRTIARLDDEHLDRTSIFFNVAHAKDDLGASGRETQQEELDTVDRIRDGMGHHLQTASLADGLFGDNPQRTFLLAHANDAAKLFVHDRWRYEEMEQENTAKSQCAEEFVVNVVKYLNMNEAAFGLADALTSLNIPSETDPPVEASDVVNNETRQLVTDALRTARAAAAAEYGRVKPLTDAVAAAGGDFQAQAAAR